MTSMSVEDAQERGFLHLWSAKDWSWNPLESRWSEDAGRPKRCVMAEASTDAIDARERYDLWRQIVWYHFDPRPLTAAQQRSFGAWGFALVSADCEFAGFRSDAVAGERRARDCRQDGGDTLTIGLVFKGERRYALGNGAAGVARPGDFFVYDAARPSSLQWTGHEGAQICISRELAHTAFGGDVPEADKITQALSSSPLGAYLRSHMEMAAGGGSRLSPREQAALLDSAKHLLLSVLWGSSGRKDEAEAEAFLPDGRLAAARHYIAAHLADPDLDVNRIARAAGCSRATLYRLFEEAGLTVAGYIRELRLENVRRLLAAAPPGAPISALAAQCGFIDSANFSRMFRQRFGQSPTEMREEMLFLRKITSKDR